MGRPCTFGGIALSAPVCLRRHCAFSILEVGKWFKLYINPKLRLRAIAILAQPSFTYVVLRWWFPVSFTRWDGSVTMATEYWDQDNPWDDEAPWCWDDLASEGEDQTKSTVRPPHPTREEAESLLGEFLAEQYSAKLLDAVKCTTIAYYCHHAGMREILSQIPASAKVRLVSRSSREWKLITAAAPPGTSQPGN